MAADTVVYEGVLELGKDTTAASLSSKDWKTRLFVLRRDPVTHIPSLSCYKDIKKRWQKQTPKAVVQLHPTFEVSLAHTSGYKFPMRLTVADRPSLFLSASSFHLMNQWLYHLQTQRLLVEKFGTYIYSVKAQEGSHTNMIGARGDLELAITTDSELLCALASTRQVLGVWPFNCLRRYWCGEGVFGFEAGKRSPRGEGTFTFSSDQDEAIYNTLKQYIEKGLAKHSTLQGKRYGDVVTDVSTRPKYPLPVETTPPVSDDEKVHEEGEELSYEQIPAQKRDLVGLPRSVSPYQRRNSLHHTDISGPNPVYMLKRTQTAKPRQIQQWVDRTEASGLPGLGDGAEEGGGVVSSSDNDPPPLHTRLEREALSLAEEDMYSHTQHVLPAPFQRRATDHNIVEESTYHALVHDRCASLKGKRDPPSSGGGGGGGGGGEGEGREDTSLYSIAYPPDVAIAEGRQVHGAAGSENEYGTLDHDAMETVRSGPMRGRTLSTLPLAPAKTGISGVAMKPRINTAESTAITNGPPTPDSSRHDLEDSMTENLLYNTRMDVVLATKITDGVRETEPAVLDSWEDSGRGRTGESNGESVEDTDDGQGAERGGGGEGGEEEGGGEGKNKTGGEGERGEAEAMEGRGGSIQRDAKGYSKVNKNKKRRNIEDINELDPEEPPPPIPPRLYEGAENDVGLHSLGNGIDTDPPPPLPTSDGVAVSDV